MAKKEKENKGIKEKDQIEIYGAKAHNLQNISLKIQETL